ALAKLSPTSSEPASPGPYVTATASRSARPAPASSSAWRTTGTTSCWCAREASSGTTPPKPVCTRCDETTLDRTRPPATTAAAVSSHELSTGRRTGRSGMQNQRFGGFAKSLILAVGALTFQNKRAILWLLTIAGDRSILTATTLLSKRRDLCVTSCPCCAS